jgi:hypothetical protein
MDCPVDRHGTWPDSAAIGNDHQERAVSSDEVGVCKDGRMKTEVLIQ